MNKKIAVIWVSLVMIFSFIVVLDVITDFTSPVKGGIVRYVNETGTGGAYTKIQDAINASSDGDTVFVYNGTYYENVYISKTLNLIGENRDGTIINGGGTGEVIHVVSNWVNITGFSLINSGSAHPNAGIFLEFADNCSIYDTNVSQNNYYGIYLGGSSYNRIMNNKIQWNQEDGIRDYLSYNNSISKNIITNNTKHGIFLWVATGCKVWDNNMSNNNRYGIYMFSSPGNIITNNTMISNSGVGAYLYLSSYNKIENNTVAWNTEEGIGHALSSYNIFTGNIFANEGIYMWGEELSYYNTHTITLDNLVNGKPLYYYKNEIGLILDGISVGAVILANCTNFSLRNLNISSTDVGIYTAFCQGINITDCNTSYNDKAIRLDYSWNCTVKQSDMIGNKYGIYLWYSYNNTFTGSYIFNTTFTGVTIWRSEYNHMSDHNISYSGNRGLILATALGSVITGNEFFSNAVYGAYLSQASDSVFSENTFLSNDQGMRIGTTNNVYLYHNNFINNTIQVTDSGVNQWNIDYPLGGNYWSDYNGPDDYKGPNQDIPGIDRIGDTSYIIDSDTQDNYPLMQPYKPIENYTVLKQGWNLISIPLIQEDKNLTRVLGSMNGWYDAIQWYDVSALNDPWKHLKIDKPFGNDLFEINETMGFWIHITRPGDTIFLYNGTQPVVNQTITLHPGWNQVGYPSLTSYNRTKGLNNLTFGTHIDAILTYNASTQIWKKLGPSDYFKIGRGYWIHAKTKCEWEVPL